MSKITGNIDEKVFPLVEFFNEKGHNKTNMSMFWIEFDKSITEKDIIDFQRKHTNEFGAFCSCGRFVIRILATGNSDKVEYRYQYMAATIEAAYSDLKSWLA